MKGEIDVKKIQIHFTAVFKNADDFVIPNWEKLINVADEKYNDIDLLKFHVYNAKDTRIVLFEAHGPESECRLAIQDFLISLLNAIKTERSFEYLKIHDLLYPFIDCTNQYPIHQSVHRCISDYIHAYAGLEIENEHDMRTNDALRVLERVSNNGKYRRRCPNCEEFDIDESVIASKVIKRCPCCGLKLTTWN